MFEEQQKLRLVFHVYSLEFLLVFRLSFMKMDAFTDSVTQLADKQFKSLDNFSIPFNQIVYVSELVESKVFTVKKFQMNFIKSLMIREIPRNHNFILAFSQVL